MTNYIFNTQANSYFQGQDLRVEDTKTHRVILINVKDGMWALSVKSEWNLTQRSQAVQRAADNLTDQTLEHLEEASKDFFWREAEALAANHGLTDGVYQEGRSGGWLCVGDTRDWELVHPGEPVTDGERTAVERFLGFCFEADDLRDTAEVYFDDRILEANMNLQVELSEYADWVGAEIRTLDGAVGEVYKLDIRQGRPALVMAGNLFSFATEATLVRKANGRVPARLTASALMQQVLLQIESTGKFTRDEVEGYIEEPDNAPDRLFTDFIEDAIDKIEDEIASHAK